MKHLTKIGKCVLWILRKFIAFWLGVIFTVSVFIFLIILDELRYKPEQCETMPKEMAHYLIERELAKADDKPKEKPVYIDEGEYFSTAEWKYEFILPSDPDQKYTAYVTCSEHVDINMQ